jgi:large subunit ribosomal protein L15
MSPKKTKDTPKKAETSAAVAEQAGISLSNLSPARGSHHRRKIVGRGIGTGHGRHATRGMKGQRSRRGDSKMIGFEGGQTPMLRRIPKRGFNRVFPRQIVTLNVCDLDFCFEANAEITPEVLLKQGVIKKNWPVKILGGGDIKKPFKVSAQSFSKQAKDKIIAAGGTVQVLSRLSA